MNLDILDTESVENNIMKNKINNIKIPKTANTPQLCMKVGNPYSTNFICHKGINLWNCTMNIGIKGMHHNMMYDKQSRECLLNSSFL